MQTLSQRDPRWKDIKLGTSKTTTIGSHGCTITCVAMLAGLTPDEVNSRLLKVNGYANTNLIIWQKIQQAIPWLKWEWRGYQYENAKVAANLPCLVEVDGKRIGASRHWVLYVGNQKMYDPWYGNEKSTSYYPPTGYSIIKKVGENPGGDMGELPPNYPDIIHNSVQWEEVVKAQGLGEAKSVQSEAVNTLIAGLKSRNTDLGNKLGIAQAEVKNREEQVGRLRAELLSGVDREELLGAQLQNKQAQLEEMARTKGELQNELGMARERIATLEAEKGNGEYTLTIGELIKMILSQKITIRRKS